MSDINNTQQTNNEPNDNGLLFKDLIQISLSKWYWFIISMALCGSLAFLYLNRVSPTYERKATILVKDSRKGSGTDLAAFGDLLGGMNRRSVENEIYILQSRRLMEQVVNKYDLATRYTTRENIRNVDMYGRTPLLAKFLTAKPSDVGSFRYTTDEEGNVSLYEFEDKEGPIGSNKLVIKAKAGDTIATPLGNIVMIETPYLQHYSDREIVVTKSALNEVIESYRKRVICAIAAKQASVIAVTLYDAVPTRAEHVINGLIDAYNIDAIEDKQTISNITREFIVDRLTLLGEELNLADSDIANFKQENRLYYPSSELVLGVEELQHLRKESLTLEGNREMAQYILSYIRDGENSNTLIPAATVTMSGASSALASQIDQYNNSVLQYERLRSSAAESNPVIVDLEMQLAEIRKVIISSLISHIDGLNLQIEQVNRQQNLADSKMQSSPTKEKELLSKARQQKVKEELYIFLLTKLEENALTGATAESNARIIDAAYGSNRPVSPKKTTTFMLALLIGIAIPFAIIYLYEIFNTTVRSRRDIEEAITAPFLGDIPLHNGKYHGDIIVKDDSRDPVSEAFRMVRTNLSFMAVDKSVQVLMLTSSIPHSGKTFVTLNLAATLAASGKRTVVVDIDLRRRTLSKMMGHRNNRRGMTSYLSNKVTSIDDIIFKSEHDPNLDFIFSGPQPPNPTEMLMSQRVDNFINELRERYDYVLIDSVPAMAVADALIMDRLVDLTVYVIRQGNLDRRHLPDIEHLYREKKFHNMSIILNGVTNTKRSYGYGYGYGYLSESEEESALKRGWKKVTKPFRKA